MSAASGFDLWRAPLGGRRLIEASAGTGKTFTLAWTWARWLVERDLRPEQILVVTFTEAAAAELRDRLRATLVDALAALEPAVSGVAREAGPADDAVGVWRARWSDEVIRRRLRSGLLGFDRAWVTTIHGFCRRVLVERAFEAGQPFEAELSAASEGLRARVLRDAWCEVAGPLPPELVQAAAKAQVLRRLVALSTGARPPTVRPDVAPAAVVAALTAATATRDAARDRLAAVWPGSLAAVVASLPVRGNLSAVTFSARALGEIAAMLDAAAAGDPDVDLKRAELLLPARMARAVKGKGTLDPALVAELAPLTVWCEAALAVEAARASAVPAVLAAVARAAARRWPDTRPSPGTLLFDDLLVRLRAALVGPSGDGLARGLREALPVAMVDEFQDTDPVQWDIFRAIYPDRAHDLTLVGDPKQAIYRFRGADLPTYLDARGSVASVEVLGRNFRSDQAIVGAIHALFAAHADPFRGAGIDWPEVKAARAASPLAGPLVAGGPLRLLRGEALEDVAADVVRALSGGHTLTTSDGARALRPGDCAVLCRVNDEAQVLQAALLARGVPAVRRARESVFASIACRELGVLLDALLAPTDLGAVRAALGTALIGLSAPDVAALGDDDGPLGAWLDRLAVWRSLWMERGLARLVSAVVEHVGLDALVGRQGGDRLVTNLRHLTELASREAATRGLGPVALRRWLIEAAQDEGMEDAELRLESDADAVQVVTLHASKGLEYGVVWVVGLDHHRQKAPLVPMWHEGHELVVDLSDPNGASKEAEEEQQEAMRLAYVGLTRARHAATVFFGPTGKRKPPPSAIGHLLQLLEWTDLDDAAAALGLPLRDARPTERAATWRAPQDAMAASEPPRITRRFAPDQRLTSFSALVRGREDELEHEPDLPPEGPQEAPSGGGGATVTLAAFPRGAEPGTAVHAVLEALDFQDPASADAVALFDQQLARHGVDAAAWAPTLRVGIEEMLATSVLPGGTRLADVPRLDRLDELAFSMWGGRRVSTARLAETLAGCGDRALEAYAPRLATLGASVDDAVLQGFIDLVFRAEGQVWVVDYKTNHLGDARDDYTPAACWRAMVEHDYVLQALLYTLAVHRFLRLRLRGYDYDRDVGGVRYLFVRGMHPTSASGRGVVAFRPPRRVIEAWDVAFGEGP